MIVLLLADALVLVHLTYIVFVVVAVNLALYAWVWRARLAEHLPGD